MIKNQIELLNELFIKLNTHFFNSALPTPIINLVKHKGVKGYFLAHSFKYKDNDEYVHEIAMNPELFNYEDKVIGSTLLHEMVHLWQFVYGTPASTLNYHNKEFAEKMFEVGLETYDLTTNKATGYSIAHRIIENGRYSNFFDNNIKEQFIFVSSDSDTDNEIKSRMTKKTKYICRLCEKTIAWGKPNQKLICGDCHEIMDMEVKE